jgi:hypothetical protein
MKLNNTAVVFLQLSLNHEDDSSKYDILSNDAVTSFKTFHPNVDVYLINNKNVHDYISLFETKEPVELYENIGIFKLILTYHVMNYYGYEKIMSLGVDTITCGYLEEFMNDSTDILATLNYPCQESTEYWTTPILNFNHNGQELFDHGNINADVVCFNNKNALKDIIQLSVDHFTHFAEQGALNEMTWVKKTYPVKIVDFPYPISKVVYNARSKGVFGTDMIKNGKLNKCGIHDGKPSPIYYWYVKDNELYTSDNKKIKVFHYVEGLNGRSIEDFNSTINNFKTWFNPETIKFFKKTCGCKLFA